MNFWEMNCPFGFSKLSFDMLESEELEDDWNQLLHAWECFSNTIDCILPENERVPRKNTTPIEEIRAINEADKKRTIN